MRITLVGSRHFGVTTLEMLRQRGVDIVRVVVRMTRRRAGFAVAAVAAVALAVGIGADRFAGWWADPLTGARGVAPNDGVVDNQSREASGYLYQLQRFHKPAVHYILGNERAEWAELWDLQTKLGRAINDETGQEDDCLTVAGGYRLIGVLQIRKK